MIKFTLKDKLVQQSLKKISTLNNKKDDLMFIIVGGLSVQAYATSSDFYRPTNDVDLMALRRISPSEFREDIGKEISSYLDMNGYKSKLGKTRYGYEIRTGDKGENFFIHLTKFSETYLKRNNRWKQREFRNAKKIYLSELGDCPVIALIYKNGIGL